MAYNPPDVPALMAALHSAWEEVRGPALRLERVVDCGEGTAEGSGLKTLLDELWEEHWQGLFEIGILDRKGMRSAQVEELLARFPNGERAAFHDELSQAATSMVECLRVRAVQRLGLLETLQGATLQQLESWTPEGRASFSEALEPLRGGREEYLSRLSCSDRCEWERRIGS